MSARLFEVLAQCTCMVFAIAWNAALLCNGAGITNWPWRWLWLTPLMILWVAGTLAFLEHRFVDTRDQEAKP